MSEPDGLVIRKCEGTVSEVLDRLRGQLKQRKIHMSVVIDHGRAASDAGLHLSEEVVAIFGNPTVGTPLMQHNPRAGMDLPLRILIWDDRGTTMAAFSPPQTLAARFSLDGESLPIRPLSALLEELTESISR